MKFKMDAYLLHIFFGFLGMGRFYVGDNKLGVLNLCTFGGFGILWLIDFFLLWKRIDQVNSIIDAMNSFSETAYSSLDSRLLKEFKDNSNMSYGIVENLKVETQSVKNEIVST